MKVVFSILTGLILLVGNPVRAQKTRVACIGDSVTEGYLLANPQQDAYPAQLQRFLGEKFEVGNFGFSGATLLQKGHRPYAKTSDFREAIQFNADVAVIHLGLNDTDPRNWPNYKDEFKRDYQWLINSLKQGNPGIKLYICKLTPIFSGHPRFKSGTREWYWQIQETIDNIAKTNGIPLIDLNTALNNRPELFADNLHPDAAGAEIIAKTVYQQLTGNNGGFKLNPLFSSNMVLQRDRIIPVYGSANANDQVEVRFNNLSRKVTADPNGKWRVAFPAMKYGGPYTIEVTSGTQTVYLKNILIGDVWICSGQSNMAFPLKAAATAQASLNALSKVLPLRLLKFNVLAETDNVSWDTATLNKINQLDYFSGTWSAIDQQSAAEFSAVAYYFGEKIVQQAHIPVGLIQMAVGGSTLESWIDRKTMEQDDLLVDVFNNWRKSDFIQDWARGRADVNLKNAINPKQRHPYEPAYNYEAGISKLIDFPIKGAIWYQGESNAHNAELFSHEFPLLISSWRKKWNQDFPFYYVQLSGINRPSWPHFRNAQRKLQALIPNTAMAVSIDLGDSLNVHPTQKKQVGERLALLALKDTYGKKIQARGPEPLIAVKKHNKVVITFAHAQKLQAASGTTLKGFELEDDKGNYLTATAHIFKNQVHLTIPANRVITGVRYAWQPFTRANLINEAKLPASTFLITIP